MIINTLTIFNPTKVFQNRKLTENYHTFVSSINFLICKNLKNTINMIQTVLKRDGRIVGFNEEKIVTAIRKAMLHTDKGEDMQLIRQITDHISFKGDAR